MRINNGLAGSLLACLFVGWLVGSSVAAPAKEYDGIWFLGFNLNKPIFKELPVRQAVNQTLDKETISLKIASEESVPVSVLPPGTLGYDPDLAPVLRDIPGAKQLMKQAGYPINDPRLKELSLLHTDGLLTVGIAKEIQNDLKAIGLKVALVEVPYSDESRWVKELASGRHDFYLMGYKAGLSELFTDEAEAREVDSASLVEPLFSARGEANFTGYDNPELDKLLNQISGFKLALKSERHAKLKRINQLVYRDLPVIVLFYIEKM